MATRHTFDNDDDPRQLPTGEGTVPVYGSPAAGGSSTAPGTASPHGNPHPYLHPYPHPNPDSHLNPHHTLPWYPPPVPAPPGPPLPYHRMALAAGVRGWWRPLLGTLVVLCGAVLAAFAVFAGSEIAGAVLDRPRDGDGNVLWGGTGDTALALLSLALCIPVVLLAARWTQRRPVGTVSSVTGALRWRWLWLCLAVALPVSAAILGISLLLPDPEGGGQEMTWAGLSPFLLGLATVCLLVPFQAAAEEYVFRGWLTQAVGTWFRSPWIAVAPQAVLFAAAHGWGTPWGFVDLVVFGLVAGLLTVRTGGLEAAIALHVLNNLLAMGFMAALAGGLATDETAADMGGLMLAVDVPLVVLYAAVVLYLARRRGITTHAPHSTNGHGPHPTHGPHPAHGSHPAHGPHPAHGLHGAEGGYPVPGAKTAPERTP
ncbi:CPBP family intramembrane glutamic endopeptidase [Streptomyces sp. 11x1]|uniref:CPBP family intramembrane glutamic endopeptidase n=1 Tax=Streptomyces sp. 11x1 TaxID=3038642 RepID=UPI00292CDA08|nr:CPBP family intramembrane glutamic endopeptidase [Streptomyces sp. 11x1]WNZ09954.1 CPBP family intramembrane metalloprotease [Streptomyces sp. 11x1]